MDWGRYLRAMKARRIEGVEAQRMAAINDTAKMTPELAELVLEHTKLLREIDDG